MGTVSGILQEEQLHEQKDLQRALKNRHIQMIAIGGAIGVGLFLGAARAIEKAGPGLVLSYAAGGVIIFFIMRALGELLLYRPVAGSFASYAERFVSPFAGFATGWSYWFMWVVVGMAEITAVAVYIHYWFPNIPQWLPALITLVVLYGANMIAVKMFGELEFWFALIKVITIIALIVIGLVIILFGVSPLGPTASFSNLWSQGGFTPFGILGVVLTLQIVMFAYQGVELIGVTAGEAENPEKVLPNAINNVIWRILIFYIGALLIIMSLVPWNQLNPGESPFVFVFEKMGIKLAPDVINFVVITAAASSCNSGLFSTGRMLYALAQVSAGAAHIRSGQPKPCPRRRHHLLRYLDGDRRPAQLRRAGTGLRVGDQHLPGGVAMDMGHHHDRAPWLPEGGTGRSGEERVLPHARRAVHQLDVRRLSGSRRRFPVPGPRDPRGALCCARLVHSVVDWTHDRKVTWSGRSGALKRRFAPVRGSSGRGTWPGERAPLGRPCRGP